MAQVTHPARRLGPRIVRPALVLLALLAGSLPASADGISQRLQRLQRLQQLGTLHACVWDMAAIIGVARHDAELDHTLLTELATELQVRLVTVPLPIVQIPAALVDGRCDVALAGLPRAGSAAQALHFGGPLFRWPLRAVTTAGHRAIRAWADLDQPGRRIAVARGSYPESVIREQIRHAELLVVEEAPLRLGDLESGRIDAVIVLAYTADRLRSTFASIRSIAPVKDSRPLEIALACVARDAEWSKRIDAFSERLRADGRLLALARRFGATAYLAP